MNKESQMYLKMIKIGPKYTQLRETQLKRLGGFLAMARGT